MGLGFAGTLAVEVIPLVMLTAIVIEAAIKQQSSSDIKRMTSCDGNHKNNTIFTVVIRRTGMTQSGRHTSTSANTRHGQNVHSSYSSYEKYSKVLNMSRSEL